MKAWVKVKPLSRRAFESLGASFMKVWAQIPRFAGESWLVPDTQLEAADNRSAVLIANSVAVHECVLV